MISGLDPVDPNAAANGWSSDPVSSALDGMSPDPSMGGTPYGQEGMYAQGDPNQSPLSKIDNSLFDGGGGGGGLPGLGGLFGVGGMGGLGTVGIMVLVGLGLILAIEVAK